MAQKITGAQLEYDANAPLIDVDTALEDLAEDLQRAGRIRQLHALRHVCSAAQQANAPWRVLEQEGSLLREIDSYNWTTRVIMLAPIETLDEGDE